MNRIAAVPSSIFSDRTRVHVRYMIRRDMPEVLAIEHASFDFPWCEDEFLSVLRQRNCIGMVAEHGERIVGFFVFAMYEARLEVLDFAVAPEFRRQGVGRQMTIKLVGKLSIRRRTRIVLHVRETNIGAQRFFRDQGFRATEVVRGHFEDTGEDAYTFVYQVEEE